MVEEKIMAALSARSATKIPEPTEPPSVNGAKPLRSSPKVTFKSCRAFVINHPRLAYDYTKVSFLPTTQIPRSAQFMLSGQSVVILIHTNDTHLPAAKGSIPKLETVFSFKNLFRRKKERDNLVGFKYLTSEYVYRGGFSSDQESNKLRFETNTKSFIEAVGGGKLWQEPETMGPWEFGGHLSLNALKRQLTKHRHAALAKQLDSTVKWMIGGLIVAIVFAVLLITQGN